MSNTININFEPDELAGLYFLAQLGLISVELNERIKSVKLKDESKDTRSDYREGILDFKETVAQLRSLPGGNGAKPALDRLGDISKVLDAAYKSMYGQASDETDETEDVD